ncbi:MAG: class I SAM-dependent methyltransferase [Anaerolineae bacterium]
MEPSAYETLYLLEDTHWWCVGMREVAWALLDDLPPPPRTARALDLGCGTGGFLRELQGQWPAVGADLADLALRYCQRRGLRGTVQASADRLPFPDGAFGLVTCMDVLYHRAVVDERTALREIRRVLAPGGWFLVRVPAYRWLFGPHDLAEHGARRYTAGTLRTLLGAAGFAVRRLTYANAFLFPLAAVRRLLGRAAGGEPRCDLRPVPPALNRLLLQVLRAEARWLRRGTLPFGLSVLALAQKPAEEE